MLRLVQRIATAGGITLCDLIGREEDGHSALWGWSLLYFSDSQWQQFLAILDVSLNWNATTCNDHSTALLRALFYDSRASDAGDHKRKDVRASTIVSRTTQSLDVVADSKWCALTAALYNGRPTSMGALLARLPDLSLMPETLRTRTDEVANSFVTTRSEACLKRGSDYCRDQGRDAHTEALLAAGQAFMRDYPHHVVRVLCTYAPLPNCLLHIILECLWRVVPPKGT
jgi:hypothetical protein